MNNNLYVRITIYAIHSDKKIQLQFFFLQIFDNKISRLEYEE